jgi:choline dehydrogenase-like flavoprotein
MGFSSEDSVIDSGHRSWEVPNLFISDGSVFPTEGAANPALIIMALADRLADLLKRKESAKGPAVEAASRARRTRLLRRKEERSLQR